MKKFTIIIEETCSQKFDVIVGDATELQGNRLLENQ